MEEEIAKIIFRMWGHRKELAEFNDAKSLVSRSIDGLDQARIAELVMKMARDQEPPAFLS